MNGHRNCQPQVVLIKDVRFTSFLLIFSIDTHLELTLFSFTFIRADFLLEDSLTELEYVYDIVLFCEVTKEFNGPKSRSKMFGMILFPFKCKMLLSDWPESTRELIIESEPTEWVDHFICFGSLISIDRLMSGEISTRVHKTKLPIANFHHQRRGADVLLLTEGRVYSTAVCSILIYGCETRSSRVDNIHVLPVFDQRCPRTLLQYSEITDGEMLDLF